jgi:DNA-directed RNA polymerase specialized sigma24 family protein
MDRRGITELLEKQDWGDIAARLVKFLVKRGATPATADDLSQQAIKRVLAFESEWDPETQPVLLSYLMGVARMLLFKHRREQKRLVAHDPHDDEDESPSQLADGRAHGEAHMAAMDLYERRIALLRERLLRRESDDAVRLLELKLQGIDKPAELVASTGWTAAAVTRALDRFDRAAQEVAQDLAGDEDEDDDEVQ